MNDTGDSRDIKCKRDRSKVLTNTVNGASNYLLLRFPGNFEVGVENPLLTYELVRFQG